MLLREMFNVRDGHILLKERLVYLVSVHIGQGDVLYQAINPKDSKGQLIVVTMVQSMKVLLQTGEAIEAKRKTIETVSPSLLVEGILLQGAYGETGQENNYIRRIRNRKEGHSGYPVNRIIHYFRYL